MASHTRLWCADLCRSWPRTTTTTHASTGSVPERFCNRQVGCLIWATGTPHLGGKQAQPPPSYSPVGLTSRKHHHARPLPEAGVHSLSPPPSHSPCGSYMRSISEVSFCTLFSPSSRFLLPHGYPLIPLSAPSLRMAQHLTLSGQIRSETSSIFTTHSEAESCLPITAFLGGTTVP